MAKELSNAYMHLTPTERIRALFQAKIDNQEPTPQIYERMPPSQIRTYNSLLEVLTNLYRFMPPLAIEAMQRSKVILLQALLSNTNLQWAVERKLVMSKSKSPTTVIPKGPSAAFGLIELEERLTDPEHGEANQFVLDLVKQIEIDSPGLYAHVRALQVVYTDALEDMQASDMDEPRISGPIQDALRNIDLAASLVDFHTQEAIELPNEPDIESLEAIREVLSRVE